MTERQPESTSAGSALRSGERAIHSIPACQPRSSHWNNFSACGLLPARATRQPENPSCRDTAHRESLITAGSGVSTPASWTRAPLPPRIFFNPVEIGLPAPCRRFIIDLYEHPDSERWETGPSQPVPGTGAGSDCQSRGAVETVDLQGLSLLGKIRKVVSGSDTPQPDLFISAGHATHIPLICARHHFKTRAVLCMKPTLPCTFLTSASFPAMTCAPGATIRIRASFPPMERFTP